MSNSNQAAKNNKAEPKYKYPIAPPKDDNLRKNNPLVKLKTNLLKLMLTKQQHEQKLCIYSIFIEPELASDNYSLKQKIHRQIDSELNQYFTRKYVSGDNLFASTADPKPEITIPTNVEEKDFIVKIKLVGEMSMEQISDFEGPNMRKKSFLEKLIKTTLLSNKNTLKFGSAHTIVKINTKNVKETEGPENIYKGYYTSAQITESGLYLLVLNVNKHVKTKTAYDKIQEIWSENSFLQPSDVKKVVENYFATHKTVLTTYGALRTYRVQAIDFDANPKSTTFNIKDKDNKTKTISVADYYKLQYNYIIKHLEQPLLIAENKEKNRKIGKKEKLDKSNNENPDENPKGEDKEKEKSNQNQKEEKIIYLVPELLYITESSSDDKDNKNKRGANRTRVDPNMKMKEICSITELMNSNVAKSIKGKDGQTKPGKTPLQISKEWGITLGENLSIQGRLLPQPHLLYARNQTVIPKNGRFQSAKPYKGVSFNNNNIVYVYDSEDKSDIRASLKNILDKARQKEIKVDLDIKKMHGVELRGRAKWDEIYRSLDIIKRNAAQIEMAIIFLSPQLEKLYSKLKSFFTNEGKFPTQFIVSKKLQDAKRAGSIIFNVVEQINVKMGGINFMIDFYKENILSPSKIYMIMGLECRQTAKDMSFVLTASVSKNMNKIITLVETVENKKEPKEKAIDNLMRLSLEELKNSGAKRPPDYIVLYRQGGNSVQNRRLAESEVPIFTRFLKHSFKDDKIRPKLIYVCCNLKSDLKFFETNPRGFTNPQSGVCVDSSVTQKDKYEFYIQPQLVNQGTATPCHYQVLFEDFDEKEKENRMKLEQLQMLSFYLSYYYWTWSGAIRVPSALKLATTAMDFYTKHLNGKLEKENKIFKNPEYI